MDGLATLLINLSDATSVSDFQARLVRGIAGHIQHGKVLAVLQAAESGELDFDQLKYSDEASPVSAAWLKSHLERHPELPRKLKQGEMVGVTQLEGSTTPQPAGVRRSLMLLPVIVEGQLGGVIGLVLPVDGLQLPEEEVEFARQASLYISPMFARVREIERLRSDRRDNESLKAILEMQAHLQSNVAHELRTPLATVRGYTRMILDGRAGEIAQTQRDYLNIVTENANRLISLVNWMSHVLQYGAQHLTVAAADLRDIWSQALKSQDAVIAEKAIQVMENIPAEPFVTTCDRGKLEYVFNSLLANALRCTDNGGKIVVEFSRGRQREITVKVTDFGGGLPPEQVGKIFERSYGTSFSSANPTETGLAGVYDIVGLHGGRLFVNSRTGEGSTFLFTLPAVRQDSEEKSGDDQAVNPGRRRR